MAAAAAPKVGNPHPMTRHCGPSLHVRKVAHSGAKGAEAIVEFISITHVQAPARRCVCVCVYVGGGWGARACG